MSNQVTKWFAPAALLFWMIALAGIAGAQFNFHGNIQSFEPGIYQANETVTAKVRVKNTGPTVDFQLRVAQVPSGWDISISGSDTQLIFNDEEVDFELSVTPSDREEEAQVILELYSADFVFRLEDTQDFILISKFPPGEFRITQPENGDDDVPVPFTLSWTRSSSAQFYKVFVHELSPQGSPLDPPVFQTETPDRSVLVNSIGLQKGKNYQIEVEAKNEVGEIDNTGGPIEIRTVAPPPLGSFHLTFPEPGEEMNRHPSFAWTASERAESYLLSVIAPDEQGDPSQTIVRQVELTGLSYDWEEPPLAIGDYFVAVQAQGPGGPRLNEEGLVPFAIRSLGPFELLDPGNGLTKVWNLPEFRWSPSFGVDFFLLEVFEINDPDPMTLSYRAVIPEAGGIPFHPLPETNPLDWGKSYQWQVTAMNELESRTSSNGPFTFSVTPLAPFYLREPGFKERGVSTTPLFEWDAAQGAEVYRLDIAPENTNGEPDLFDLIISDSIFEPMWQYDKTPLERGARYFWRVVASDGVNIQSNRLSWRPFEVDPLTDFSLLGPQDQATNVEPDPLFSWDPSDGAVAYRFFLIFIGQTVVFDVPGDTTSLRPSDHRFYLNGDQEYIWSVEAVGPDSSRAALAPRSFSTGFRASVQSSCEILNQALGYEILSAPERSSIGIFDENQPIDAATYVNFLVSFPDEQPCE